MAYGYSTEVPIDSGYIPQSSFVPGRPDMPDASMPIIAAASTDTLGRRNTLAKALPAMPASEMGDLSFSNYKQVEAYENMRDLAVGQADRKLAERQNAAQRKHEEQQMQHLTEKAAKNHNSRNAYRRSEYDKNVDRSAVRRIAQGIGALNVLYAIR